MKSDIQGREGMASAAARLLASLSRGGSASVVALSGDLGAGKTTFTQGLASALGVAESVTSPTFVIEKVYELSGQKWERLIHIDAYRLKDVHELEVLGWQALVRDPANLIVVEWPEHVASAIPADATRVTLAFLDEETRSLSYAG